MYDGQGYGEDIDASTGPVDGFRSADVRARAIKRNALQSQLRTYQREINELESRLDAAAKKRDAAKKDVAQLSASSDALDTEIESLYSKVRWLQTYELTSSH